MHVYKIYLQFIRNKLKMNASVSSITTYFVVLLLCSFTLYSQEASYRRSGVYPIWKSYAAKSKPMIQEDALNKMESFIGSKTRPVTVITIVGDYHSGKSSFLNALVGGYDEVQKKDVFEVAADIPPQTQGFEAVILIDDDDVSKPAIILIDTPGTSAVDFGVDEQAAYFGASYLMSSTLLYTTLRRVGSRADLDYLADRLRYVSYRVIHIHIYLPLINIRTYMY